MSLQKEYGIVERVLPHSELHSHTLDLAKRIARHNPVALRYAKKAIQASNDLELFNGLKHESILAALCLEESSAEDNVRSFLSKKRTN